MIPYTTVQALGQAWSADLQGQARHDAPVRAARRARRARRQRSRVWAYAAAPHASGRRQSASRGAQTDAFAAAA